MAVTYDSIATTTLGSNTTVTFSSIPQTYTDLILVTDTTGTTNGAMDVRINGDSSAVYSRTGLYGDGTTAGSYRNTGLTYGLISAGTSGRSISITHFMNYSNSTTYKSFLTRGGSAATDTGAAVYLWRSTSAITSLVLTGDPIGSNIGAGSVLTLYGIKSA